jgi:hypothetical protein
MKVTTSLSRLEAEVKRNIDQTKTNIYFVGLQILVSKKSIRLPGLFISD